MYTTLLVLHSLLRTLILISLLFATYRAFAGWLGDKEYSKFDYSIRLWTSMFCHIQLLIGIGLYFVSPLVSVLLGSFKESMKIKEVRFYGMEHGFLMLLAIALVTVGSSISKRKATDKEKFKAQAVWFSAGLVIIGLTLLLMSSSSFAPRPWFRGF